MTLDSMLPKHAARARQLEQAAAAEGEDGSGNGSSGGGAAGGEQGADDGWYAHALSTQHPSVLCVLLVLSSLSVHLTSVAVVC